MLSKIPGNVQGDSGECLGRFRGILSKIPVNFLILVFRGILENIPGNVQEDSGDAIKDSGECSRRFQGNVQEDSGECYQRFRGMLSKILVNVQEDSGECSKRFRGMFRKIPGNAFNLKLIKALFYLKKTNLKLTSEA